MDPSSINLNTKGPIEVDTSLVRFFYDIRIFLIQPRIYEEIRALMEELDEEVSLVNLWYVIFFLFSFGQVLCFVLLFVLSTCGMSLDF